jgi:ribonuclease P protein component
MNHTNSFSKNEHLCGEITIGRLYAEGKAFIAYPLRVVYSIEKKTDSDETVRILISVPKKRFKSAVKRNKIKRLIRENYRLNKHELIEFLKINQIQIKIAFNFISDELPEFETLQKKLKLAIKKIINEYELSESQSV